MFSSPSHMIERRVRLSFVSSWLSSRLDQLAVMGPVSSSMRANSRSR